MNALLQLISHEYRKYVFTRGFLLLILIVPMAMMFGIFAQQFNSSSTPIRHFVVIDETGEFLPVIDDALNARRIADEIESWDNYVFQWVKADAEGSYPLIQPFQPTAELTPQRETAFRTAGGIEAGLREARPHLREGAPENIIVRARYVRVEIPADAASLINTDDRVSALLPYLNSKKMLENDKALFAVVVIPENYRTAREITFWTNNLLASDLRNFIGGTTGEALRNDAFAELGVTADQVDVVRNIRSQVIPRKADQAEQTDSIAATVSTVIPLFLTYFLFVMVLSVGGMLLTNTVEEKSNKIVEVLLSSVSAGQLMAGKLIGLALVGITIPAIFIGGSFIAIQFLGTNAAPGPVAPLIEGIQAGLFDSPLIPLFFLYFILGYLLFASIYLAVGALSESIQDAQSFLVPMTVLLMLPLPFLTMVIQDPNGIVARVLTFIPLYTPYAIMLRIPAQPPVWEIVAASALLLITVSYVVFTMGKIYRRGVLSSGAAPSWKLFFGLLRR